MSVLVAIEGLKAWQMFLLNQSMAQPHDDTTTKAGPECNYFTDSFQLLQPP